MLLEHRNFLLICPHRQSLAEFSSRLDRNLCIQFVQKNTHTQYFSCDVKTPKITETWVFMLVTRQTCLFLLKSNVISKYGKSHVLNLTDRYCPGSLTLKIHLNITSSHLKNSYWSSLCPIDGSTDHSCQSQVRGYQIINSQTHSFPCLDRYHTNHCSYI